MKVYIHYAPKQSPGYTPREPVRLFNVDSIHDAGVGMVKVKMQFADNPIVHDHVVRVVVEPDTELSAGLKHL